MNTFTIEDIEALTFEHGGNWGAAHVRRVLRLIGQIGAGIAYDAQALTWAAWLHDWGAYPSYALAGVEHAVRSRQVAGTEILPHADLSGQKKALLLEAIDLHDYRDERPACSTEALLLREADFLDFLGAIGIAREFAKGPKDLGKSHRQILKRRALIEGRFTLPEAKRLAAERLAVMDAFFKDLQDEGFGFL